MAAEQIDQFMNAISSVESGHNYNATGPYTGSTYGRARGRYQIMETIYPGWAREAGVNPKDYSPAAQDRVARHKMTQYYKKYGSWDLVAVAWFAGPGNANKAQRAGVKSLAGASDMLGTTVPSYVAKVIKNMGGGGSPSNAALNEASFSDAIAQTNAAAARGDFGQGRDASVARGDLGRGEGSVSDSMQSMSDQVMDTQPSEGGPDREPLDSSSMADIMSFISQQARERGSTQVLDLKALLGERMGSLIQDG